MVLRRDVEDGVVSVAGATTVEAVETDIQAGRVVLGGMSVQPSLLGASKVGEKCSLLSQSTAYSPRDIPTALVPVDEALRSVNTGAAREE
jgi:hypothetical protein